MSPLDESSQDVSLHKLATIGFVQSFGQKREYFFYRRDMSEDGLRNLVENFVDRLELAQKEMKELLPQSIILGYENYRKLVADPDFKKKSPEFKAPFFKKLSHLRQILSLPTYSWNGEKYDLTVMLGPLIEIFSRDKKKFGRMTVIKRGTSFMEIRYDFLILRDFMNFSSPMSLGKFAL